MLETSTKTGYITQIIGPVLDVVFPGGDLPKIYNAIVVTDGEKTCLLYTSDAADE